MAKTDPVIDQMNSFALALLDAAREAKVETVTGETDHLSIAERVNVFREVAKWISIKNRLPEPAEGGDLDEYRARLNAKAGESRADDPADPRGQARVLVEQGRAIAERAVTTVSAPDRANAVVHASVVANVQSPAPLGTPRRAFNPDGTAVRGSAALRPIDAAEGGADLEAIRARLPSGGGGHAGGVRGNSGFEVNPVTGRPRGLRRGRDGAHEPDADDAC